MLLQKKSPLKAKINGDDKYLNTVYYASKNNTAISYVSAENKMKRRLGEYVTKPDDKEFCFLFKTVVHWLYNYVFNFTDIMSFTKMTYDIRSFIFFHDGEVIE